MTTWQEYIVNLVYRLVYVKFADGTVQRCQV